MDKVLAAAIFRRHTNRRPLTDQAVPEAVRGALRQAERSELAWLVLVPPAKQSELRGLLTSAHRDQLTDPRFVDEWRAPGPEGDPAALTGCR